MGGVCCSESSQDPPEEEEAPPLWNPDIPLGSAAAPALGNWSWLQTPRPQPTAGGDSGKPPNWLLVRVMKALRLPALSAVGVIDAYVKVLVNGVEMERTAFIRNNDCPVWNCVIELAPVDLKDNISFVVMAFNSQGRDGLVGLASMRVSDFIRRPSHVLPLFLLDSSPVIQQSSALPSELEVAILTDPYPAGWPLPQPSPYSNSSANASMYPKHVMVLTRGTRGDVQPFVALARGLAEGCGYMVTICTELAFRDFVMQNSQVSRGCIRFRPTGGDTLSRIDKPVARWALNNSSELLQVIIMSRCEVEFFESEPLIFHYAQNLKPDLLIYGITMLNISMIVSEVLQIPMIGFVLQPACIPSSDYPAIVPMPSGFIPLFDKLEEKVTSHGVQKFLRKMMEDNPFSRTLSTMRKRRGLPAIGGDAWRLAMVQKQPVVVPIPQATYGTRPSDWHENIVFTEFIFLRDAKNGSRPMSGVPRGPPPLPAPVAEFLAKAKRDAAPVIAMTFSSMPVPLEDIINVAITIAERCADVRLGPSTTLQKPRVLALTGKRSEAEMRLPEALAAR
eukprot:RCo018797